MSHTVYALYAVFMGSDDLREELADPDDRRDAVQEIENLYKSWEGTITVRGTYSTVGFRADADLMIWLHGPTPQDVQRALVEFRRTTIGRLTDLTWTFMGVVKPAEFTADHAPAFVKGTPPETFLCVYPFVRTPEWYLLPRDERGEKADSLVDVIRRLRETKARLYTKEEVPFITGIRKPVVEAIDDLI